MNELALPAGAGDEPCELFGLSICAGAGGLDLGVHLAIPNYRTVGYIERDSYAAATLVARMEDQALADAPVWNDVATFDGRQWRGLVDIIHGGYPCQPFSIAGRKLGDKDPRHLWPHIKRIVAEIEPALCFFENVGNHLRMGFEQVNDDLQSLGYRVKAGLFTAAEVGAPHKRERLFMLAYRDRNGCQNQNSAATGKDDPQGWPQRTADAWPCGNGDAAIGFSLQQNGSGTGATRPALPNCENSMADTTRQRTRLFERGSRHHTLRSQQDLVDTDRAGLAGRSFDELISEDAEQPFPPGPQDRFGWQRYLDHWPHLEPAVCGGADGLADRMDRLRLCGNGVVPLVAAYALCTLATAAQIEFEIA